MNAPCESCGAIGLWQPLGQFDHLCPACGGKDLGEPCAAGDGYAGHQFFQGTCVQCGEPDPRARFTLTEEIREVQLKDAHCAKCGELYIHHSPKLHLKGKSKCPSGFHWSQTDVFTPFALPPSSDPDETQAP